MQNQWQLPERFEVEKITFSPEHDGVLVVLELVAERSGKEKKEYQEKLKIAIRYKSSDEVFKRLFA